VVIAAAISPEIGIWVAVPVPPTKREATLLKMTECSAALLAPGAGDDARSLTVCCHGVTPDRQPVELAALLWVGSHMIVTTR
jgi:hypothetical protein